MKKMMTMMALMVFAISGFAVKFDTRTIPKDPSKLLDYWKSVDATTSYAAYRKVVGIVSDDLKNLNTPDAIESKVAEIILQYKIPSEFDTQLGASNKCLWAKYKIVKDKKYLERMVGKDKKTMSCINAYLRLKDYNNAYKLSIKKGSVINAIIARKNLGIITKAQLMEIVKLKKITPKNVQAIISLIRKQDQSTVEGMVKVLDMFLILSTKFPPEAMKKGTELEWAKVQVNVKTQLENLQKIIKIKLDVERALNE